MFGKDVRFSEEDIDDEITVTVNVNDLAMGAVCKGIFTVD